MFRLPPFASPADVLTGGVAEGALTRGGFQMYRGDYSFAADGGAVSTIALTGQTGIPSGATLLAAYIDVTTILASGGAPTVAVQVESAGDIQAAAAFNGAPWSTTGVKLSSARTFATAPIKTTAARDISIVIATATLTGGAFRVYVVYINAP
jgi:hypothetical protein